MKTRSQGAPLWSSVIYLCLFVLIFTTLPLCDSQHCTLLHLCVVQQYSDRRAAPSAVSAGHQYQLQRDGARGASRPERENCTQRLLRARRGHWCLFSRPAWELVRVHDHGGRRAEASFLFRCSVRLLSVVRPLDGSFVSYKLCLLTAHLSAVCSGVTELHWLWLFSFTPW